MRRSVGVDDDGAPVLRPHAAQPTCGEPGDFSLLVIEDVPMRRDFGASGGVGATEPATRMQRPAWRDTRLWLGVAMVLSSVVLGARVFAAADDTVGAWAVAENLAPGSSVGVEDLTLVRVHLADSTMDGYFSADDTLPSGSVLSRPIAAGELLPRSALVGTDRQDLAQVAVAVEPANLPPTVSTGSVVDIYAVGRRSEAALVGVSVLSVSAPDVGLGAAGVRQLVLAVPGAEVEGFFALLAGDQAPALSVVGRG